MQKGTVPCSDDYTLLTHFGQQAIWQRTKFRFKMPTKWLGSSTITLICRSTNGTLHNKERDSPLSVFVNITDGKCGGNRGALDIPVSPSFCSHCRSWLLRFLPSWQLRQQECVFCCQTQGQPALTNRRTFIARNEGAKCTHRRNYWADRWTDKEKYTKPLRRIAIRNDEHGYVVQLLTNNFKLSAPTIA